MKCPKCNYDIDENTTVCPNCKKVLKLVCPICKTLNKTNTCHKCGFIIINKCHQCGKINQTINGKCTQCGFNTYVSAVLQGSNIDEFACLTMEFPNLSDMPAVFGSVKLYNKFMEKLNNLIYNYTSSIGLKRHIIDNTYLIRFNKDFTYTISAKNAMKSAIEILNLITKINFKLTKKKSAQLKCKIAILKRSAYAQSEDYKSGINIQLLYDNIKEHKLINSLQLVVDSSIYQAVSNEYKMNAIGLTQIKNQTTMLYEVDLDKTINLKPPEDLQDDENEDENSLKMPELPDFQIDESENEDSIYDMDGITFNEIHCEFTNSVSYGLSKEIVQKLITSKKRIISVRAAQSLFPQTVELLGRIDSNKIYTDIFRVTCHEDMKYKPYGFFHELIASIYGYTSSGKLISNNNFTKFNDLDTSGFLKDMINYNVREYPHPEDVRYGLFELFECIFKSMKNTLIYIENFEKIDDTSYEMLQMLFKKFDEFDVSYLLMSDKDFTLHKNAHFLLSKREYCEINVKPAPFKVLLEANKNLYSKIIDSFYLQKIAKNTKGSPMYFMQSTIYLMDKGILEVQDGALEIKDAASIVLPPTLTELIIKRFDLIKSKNPITFKLLADLIMLGPRIDIPSLQLLGVPDLPKHLEILDAKGFIYIYRNSIYLQNYAHYYESMMKFLSREEKQSTSKHLLDTLFTADKSHPIKPVLYNILESSKNEFIEWENLSAINMSLGDFSSYLNCSIKFLKLLDTNIDETSSQKSIDQYKMEVYENIANLLYKYTPEKIFNITQVILDNLEKNTQDKKVINLCNKMMQGCLSTGNYEQALLLSHKILSRMEKAGINPKDENFNISAFLISMIKIEILFNVGDLEDCITLGTELFEILEENRVETLKPKTITIQQFIELVTDSAGFIAFAKIIQLQDNLNDFLQLVNKVVGKLPQSYGLFCQIEKVLHGEKINLNAQYDNSNSKFSKFIPDLLTAFSSKDKDYNEFAVKIYNAKLAAKAENLHSFELFCDLLIGHSYYKLGNIRKASTIYNSVLETSLNNGLKNIKYICWYLLAEISLSQAENDIAIGLTSNAVVEIERQRNSSGYILLLFKLLNAKILKLKKEDNQADFCYNQAIEIAKNHKIKL